MYIPYTVKITNCSFYDCYPNGLNQIKDGLIRGIVSRFTITNCHMYNSTNDNSDSYYGFNYYSVEDNNSIDTNKINSSMENTGSPLIALLIALISLPILRRK